MKRKICCFCECWASGGIESFLNNVILRLNPDELEVDVVAACIKESIFTQKLLKYGVRFISLSGNQRAMRKNHCAFSMLLLSRRYDVIHVNAFHALSLFYLRLAKKAGVPVRIAHSHNTALRKSSTAWLKLTIHNLAKAFLSTDATLLWACSSKAADFLFSAKCLKKMGFTFIPNGIETERFRYNVMLRTEIREKLGLAGMCVYGNVGRLCRQKNQTFLLDVFNRIFLHNPMSRLLLVGNGEWLGKLREKADQLGISQAVIFCGVTSHVEELLNAMDVFLLPSLFEGLAIAPIEAQAAGVPVLCSEAMPRESLLIDSARILPLEAGVERWAQMAVSMAQEGLQDAAVEKVCAAGFDIKDVVRRIKQVYMGDTDAKTYDIGDRSIL